MCSRGQELQSVPGLTSQSPGKGLLLCFLPTLDPWIAATQGSAELPLLCAFLTALRGRSGLVPALLFLGKRHGDGNPLPGWRLGASHPPQPRCEVRPGPEAAAPQGPPRHRALGTPYPWQEPHILTLLSAPQNDLAKPEETLLGYFYQIDRLVSASIPLNNKELITLWCGMLNPWGILIENEVTLS